MNKEWNEETSLEEILAPVAPPEGMQASDLYSDVANWWNSYERECHKLREAEEERSLWRWGVRGSAYMLIGLGIELPPAAFAGAVLNGGLAVEGGYRYITGENRRRMLKNCEDYYDYKKRKKEEEAGKFDQHYEMKANSVRGMQSDAWEAYAQAYKKAYGTDLVRAYDEYKVSKRITDATKLATEAAVKKLIKQ